MIPNVELFGLKTTSRDEYGKVISNTSIEYYGVIERQTQFRGSSPVVVIGEGLVMSSNIYNVAKVGQEIIIDEDVFTIGQVLELKDLDGSYHHTELVYG